MQTEHYAAAAATIEGALKAGHFPDSRVDFPASILAAWKKGKASPKQREWLLKLAERINNPAPKPEATPLTDARGLQAIKAMFTKAEQKLKRPSVRLTADCGTAFRLSVAGPKSKAPGTINITGEGAFAERPWFGRITASGGLERSQKCPPSPAMVGLLADFAACPAAVAAAQGKAFGHCVFCARELSDARSLEVGYGETCAGNFGLPWGGKK